MAFICKNFYALTIIKELNLDSHLSNQDDNNTYTFINNKTKDQIIKEHKLNLFKHKINSPDIIQDLPIMYRTPKMHKNPISFCFIITSLVFSIKPLSKNITSTFRPATFLKKRLWRRCFPLNFAKFPRTSFLQNISGRLLPERGL